MNTRKYLRTNYYVASAVLVTQGKEKEAVPDQEIDQEPNAVRQNLGLMMDRLYRRIYQLTWFHDHDTESKKTQGFEVFTGNLFNCFPGASHAIWLFKQVLLSVVVHHVYYSPTSQFVPKRNHFQSDPVSPNGEQNRVVLEILHVW